MVTITGKHFIFASVEQEYSPKNERGFQVFYLSKSIPDSDLNCLKDSVSCFLPSDNQVIRRQYYRLPSQDFAFINTITENHPEISDRRGRGGGYLAHGIIIDQEQFSKIQYNPFIVFGNFNFIQSAEVMIRDFDQHQHRESPCTFEANPYLTIRGGERYAQQALNLYKLTSALRQQSIPILLIGQNNEIEGFLRSAIQFAPVAMRPNYSFDTHSDNCQPPTGLYWAMGSSSQKEGTYNTIYLPGDITLSESSAESKDDIYYQWLLCTVHKDAEKAYRDSGIAQAWAIALLNRKPLPPEMVTEEASESFFEAHRKLILNLIHKTIAKFTSIVIAQNIADFLLLSKTDIREILSIAASQTISSQFLSQKIRAWLASSAQEFNQMKKSDWSALMKFADHSDDPVTLFWASAFYGDEKARQRSIKTMSDSAFETALLLLLEPIHPKDFLPCGNSKLKLLFSRITSNLDKINNEIFTEFVLALVRTDSLVFLDELAPRVSELDNKSLSRIEGKLSNLSGASLFLQSTRKRRKQLGRPEGIKGWLYRE